MLVRDSRDEYGMYGYRLFTCDNQSCCCAVLPWGTKNQETFYSAESPRVICYDPHAFGLTYYLGGPHWEMKTLYSARSC